MDAESDGARDAALPWPACALGALAAVVALLALPVPISPDTYLHLATGRLVAGGVIPVTDPFSFTLRGAPWLAHEWLAARLFYACAQEGLGLAVWLCAACVIAALGATALAMRASGVRSAAAQALALAWALGLIAPLFKVRPHVPALVPLALVCWIVRRFQRGGPARELIALPPLFALWANLHGSFPVGALPFAAAAIDLARGERRRLATLAAAAAACAAACALNPFGLQLFALPLRFLGGMPALDSALEWRAPTLADAPLQIVLLVAAVAALLAARGGASPGERAAALATLALALNARRHGALAAVVASPALAQSFATLPLGRWSAPRPAALSGAAALALALTLPWAAFHDFRYPGQFPARALLVLERSGDAGHIFHEAELGGLLAWKLGPERGTFIDFRAEVFGGTPVAADYRALLEAAPDWRLVADRYALAWLLVLRTRPLAEAAAHDPGWAVAAVDERFVLFGRPRVSAR